MDTTIDLSHSINTGMPVYPGTPSPKIVKACSHTEHGFAELEMSFASHTGTHLDAPFHILENKATLSDLDIAQFHGTAFIIQFNQNNADLASLIKNKITLHGKPEFILLQTSWSKYWGSSDYFNKFPLPNKDTFEYLGKLGLKGVGIDAISIDPVHRAPLVNHQIILRSGAVIIENLTHLEKLPNGLFDFFCFPLNIQNGDGSPVRAVAIINE